MNEDVIYRYAMAIWDRDDKESLGGKNIQVSAWWHEMTPCANRGLGCVCTRHLTRAYIQHHHHITTQKQEYLEELQQTDPVTSIPQDYVMAWRVAVLLRALGYALKYRCVHYRVRRVRSVAVSY